MWSRVRAFKDRVCAVTPPEIRYIATLFLVTRAALVTAGVVAHHVLQPVYQKLWTYSPHTWLDIFGVWDTGWILNTAKLGYFKTAPPEISVNGCGNYGVFPLYPMLIKALTLVTGDYFISGLLISNAALLTAAYYLYHLVKTDNDDATSKRAVKFLFLFPTAFILSGVFNEALFLALTIMAFYFARKERWLFVGLAGFCASLTRNIGAWAFLPLLYEYMRSKDFRIRNIRADILLLLLVPLGLFLFMIYNYVLVGDFLGFMHVQEFWGRHPSNPFTVLSNGLFSGKVFGVFGAWFTMIALFILIIFSRSIGFSYLLTGLYSLFIPLSTGLMNMQRYALVIFPYYIIFAKISKDERVNEALTIFLAIIQGFLMVMWSHGFPLIC